MMLMVGDAGSAQQGSGSVSSRMDPSQSSIPSPVIPPLPESSGNPQVEATQAKLRNAGRQKELVGDTEKLLALANELKADVDKSNKDTLSLDVIRKADEIEKLAHSVKEKMKCTGCS